MKKSQTTLEKAIEMIRSSERKKSEGGFNTLAASESVKNPFVLMDNESGEDSVEIHVSPVKPINRRKPKNSTSSQESSTQSGSSEKLRSSSRYIKSELARPMHSENDSNPAKRARILIDLCET